MRHRRIVIIGAGFAGATLALQLANSPDAPEIVLIERARRAGPGLAYSTRDEAHLLNVPAHRMSLFPDDPSDFVGWLGSAPSGYASRARYGEYLAEHLRDATKSGAISIVRAEAVSCREHRNGVVIDVSSGATWAADACVLALGNLPPATPAPFDAADMPMIDAWDCDTLARLDPASNVLLLGAGLTMVDVALTLTKTPRRGVLYALSRRGLPPQAHPADRVDTPPAGLPADLTSAFNVVRSEVRKARLRGGKWQDVIDSFRTDAPRFWAQLPLEAKRRFLRHLRPWWDTHRHRLPPAISDKVAALRSHGQLRFLAGRVVSADSESVSYRPRSGQRAETIHVGAVVNCTGPCADIMRATTPLVQQMLRTGQIRPHATGLGLDVTAQGAVIQRNGAVSERVFALGPLTQGAFWECTAAPEIRQRAADLTRALSAANCARQSVKAAAAYQGAFSFSRPPRPRPGSL